VHARSDVQKREEEMKEDSKSTRVQHVKHKKPLREGRRSPHLGNSRGVSSWKHDQTEESSAVTVATHTSTRVQVRVPKLAQSRAHRLSPVDIPKYIRVEKLRKVALAPLPNPTPRPHHAWLWIGNGGW
jgi:hypothetical protein